MKALANSCSKAIVQRPSPKSPVHASDRPEFWFSLRRCRNDKVSAFRSLQLVQNKVTYPVQALRSETQVDLDTVDLTAQQKNPVKFVRVQFKLQKQCNFGEQFFIVGDDLMFGSWDPLNAKPMTWSDGHIWTTEMSIVAGKKIQFKFILVGKEGDIIWQPGSDRFVHTWETKNTIIFREDWENDKLQKVIEEEEPSLSNEQAQIGSEMSTFAENLGLPNEELVSNVAKVWGEKPIAKADLQKIIDDSISSSQNLISINRRRMRKNVTHRNEEPAIRLKNDPIVHNLRHNGKAAPIKNQERKAVESKLFDFEGGPILLPGLTPSNEESEHGTDTSVRAFETKDQNMPEATD